MNLFRKLANRTTPIDETALHYIWLSLACGFASASARELISAYHGAGAVYAQEDFSDRAGLSDALRKRLLEKDLTDAREIYKACREKDVGILTYESDLYPSRLRTLTNPPAVLYYRGRITNLDCEPCVAVVGTRSVSRYGEEVTDWFGYELAKSGAFVVSGLAKGADGIAHRAALRAGGSTVAVLGTAIDRVYPVQNEGLFSEIESKGLILSEYYPGCTNERRLVSRTQPHHQRHQPVHRRHRGGNDQRRAHHRPQRHRAEPRRLRRSRQYFRAGQRRDESSHPRRRGVRDLSGAGTRKIRLVLPDQTAHHAALVCV